ncbi:MAG: hypothetical protein NC191_09385 [Muribaculaceae bacterium]|nr:hypothetical protein [Muribaculaceae bacterium]
MSIQCVSGYYFYPNYPQMPCCPVPNPNAIPPAPLAVSPGTASVDLNADPVAQYFNIFSAKTKHDFVYTPEEQEVLKTTPYHDFTQDFVNKRDYARALDYINQYEYDKDFSELKKYINNPAFDSLATSKYFSNNYGFKELATKVYTLHKAQQDAYNEVNALGYFCPYMPDIKRMYAAIDVNQCVTNLDKFFKSGVSEDLKTFMKDGTDKLSDLWYVSHNLVDIDKEPAVDKLSVSFPVL